MTGRTPEQYRAIVKGLFRQLVLACGGSEPAALYLGISPGRIRQLWSLSEAHLKDMPIPCEHWLPLEFWISNPIVSAGLASLSRPEQSPTEQVTALMRQALELMEAK